MVAKEQNKQQSSEFSAKTNAKFPKTRLRRLRASGWMRDLVQEHQLSVNDLIWPVFVQEGEQTQEDIQSMPGVSRRSIDLLTEELKKAQGLGIKAIALFPVVPAEQKTMEAKEAYNPDNLMCRAIQAIKKETPDIGIITDVALDPYTTHGHDGLVEDGVVLNDETVEALTRQALVQAQAGADIIAPSDMMDGRVGAIRDALDAQSFQETAIMSYTAKYASNFYGPFRDAVNSGDFLKGDKKTYQMNPANSDEALREAEQDIQEGADMIMVKPGLPYLDIVSRIKSNFNIPVFAYHVSGEYAMLRAASEKGWLNYEQALAETLIAFKRAGCSGVLTYGAMDLAEILDKS